MAELSNIAAELSKGKNVDMNLSKYADTIAHDGDYLDIHWSAGL